MSHWTHVLAVVASVVVALLAGFVLGVTVAFGSSGFGGPAVDPAREAAYRGMLLASALGPAALLLVRDGRLWLVVALQVLLLVVGTGVTR